MPAELSAYDMEICRMKLSNTWMHKHNTLVD